ncbi:MAG TPA: class I SAM-dependent methyltransferase [Candidatus Atribacteria bacterium]|nr:class I SAM-dependent methyltransferase [Candidatus Atribacteria bacterium]
MNTSFKKWFLKYRMIVVREMINTIGINGNEIILDLGTGSGFVAINFAKKLVKGKIYGVDRYRMSYNSLKEQIINLIKINFFGNTLKNAKENAILEKVADKCMFITSDITKSIDFPNETFDVILSSQALYCIPYEKRPSIFNEIHRLLKKNGKILFFESRLYGNWNMEDIRKYFVDKGYSVKIIHKNFFKNHCMLYGEKP